MCIFDYELQIFIIIMVNILKKFAQLLSNKMVFLLEIIYLLSDCNNKNHIVNIELYNNNYYIVQ